MIHGQKVRKSMPKNRKRVRRKIETNAEKIGLIERQGMRPNHSPGSHMSLSHNALDAASKYQKTRKKISKISMQKCKKKLGQKGENQCKKN